MTTAANRRAHWLWLALAVIVADRATKYLIERGMPEGSRRELLPGFAALVHAQNTGIKSKPDIVGGNKGPSFRAPTAFFLERGTHEDRQLTS